jgi:hypothetical protein
LGENNELGNIYLIERHLNQRGGGGVLRELRGGVGRVKAELWDGVRTVEAARVNTEGSKHGNSPAAIVSTTHPFSPLTHIEKWGLLAPPPKCCNCCPCARRSRFRLAFRGREEAADLAVMGFSISLYLLTGFATGSQAVVE